MAASLSGRLFLASALLLPVFLGLTGMLLDRAFQRSLETGVEERLQGHIYLLISVAELEEADAGTQLRMPELLMEPNFERLNSGLYGFIYRGDGDLVWRSQSAQLLQPPPFAAFAQRLSAGQLQVDTLKFDSTLHWQAHYDLLWQDETGAEHPFRFALLRDRSAYSAELAAYRNQLWRWLGAVTLILLVVQSAILRWGLRPVRRLAQQLKAMQTGASAYVGGEHARELQPVVDNLNQVLAREQALRQRYRDSLSNLAHSLKTPLAVLRGRVRDQMEEPELEQTLDEQLTRMEQVVSYQLQRAVSGQQRGLHRRTPLAPAAQRLASALQKVYRDKQVDFKVSVAPELEFPGEEQDLLELLGNLLENAFKYCHRRVRVAAHQEAQNLIITILDDGPGIPAAERERVVQRGQRLDSLQPGQGIGLAVAADIVESYGGKLEIEQAEDEMGGARFCLRLPL